MGHAPHVGCFIVLLLHLQQCSGARGRHLLAPKSSPPPPALIEFPWTEALLGGAENGTFEGSPASAVKTDGPAGVIAMPSGAIYWTASRAHVVQKMTTDGQVTVVAGSAELGAGDADGFPFTPSRLRSPTAMCIDETGDFAYISDNFKIKKLNLRNQEISKVAGNGYPSTVDGDALAGAQLEEVSGCAVDKDGVLFIVQRSQDRQLRLLHKNGTLASAHLSQFGNIDSRAQKPEGIAYNRGKHAMYISTTESTYIFQLSLGTSWELTRIAGSGISATSDGTGRAKDGSIGSAAFLNPLDLAVGPDLSKLYVADQWSIRAVDLTSTEFVVSTLAGTGFAPPEGASAVDGKASESNVFLAKSLALDAQGNILFTESLEGHSNIRRLLLSKLKPFPAAPPSEPPLPPSKPSPPPLPPGPFPYLLTLLGDSQSQFDSEIQSGDLSTAQIQGPHGIVSVTNTELLWASTPAHVLQRFSYATGQVTVVAGSPGVPGDADGHPSTPSLLHRPVGLCLDNTGLYVYITDAGNHKVKQLNLVSLEVVTVAGSGQETTVDGPAMEASFTELGDIAMDDTGSLLFTDSQSSSENYVRFLKDGVVTSSWLPFPPRGLSYNPQDHTAIVSASESIWSFDLATQSESLTVTLVAGGESATDPPKDGVGRTENGQRGEATFAAITGIALAPDASALYITDKHTVRACNLGSPLRNVTTIAGNGYPGYADGAADASQVYDAQGVTVGPQGNLYITENSGNRVRMLLFSQLHSFPPTPPPTPFPPPSPPPSPPTSPAYPPSPPQPLTFPFTETLLTNYDDNYDHQVLAPEGDRVYLYDLKAVITLPWSGDLVWGSAGGVQRYSWSTNKVTTLVNNVRVEGFCLGSNGHTLYLTDNHRVRSVDLNTLALKTVAGSMYQWSLDGDLTEALFDSPGPMVMDRDGILYVGERYSGRLRVIANGEVSTVNIESKMNSLSDIRGLAYHTLNHSIYIADIRNCVICFGSCNRRLIVYSWLQILLRRNSRWCRPHR